MRTIIVDSEGSKQRAAGLVRALEFDPPMLVEIKKYVKKRTLLQNKLLMKWCNALSAHWFESTGELFSAAVWKEQLKQDFLGIESFSLPNGYIATRTRRTRDLNTREFAEFLEKIDAYAASELECILPHPDDLYFEALMKTTTTRKIIMSDLTDDTQSGCECPSCKDDVKHWSDCAVHNAPALPVGPCDCGEISTINTEENK